MSTDTNLIVCPACRAINRVQTDRATEATCGKCKSKVFEPKAIELVGATFDRHINKTELPVLVDFYSSTCAPCLMMGPQFEDAAKTLHPSARLAKIESSEEVAIAQRFRIQSVPTLVLFKGGKEVSRQNGAMLTQEIVNWVKKHI
ncbi:MAG: thioredoxin domain-containing protein [Pseudodesulfovibrio sp.]